MSLIWCFISSTESYSPKVIDAKHYFQDWESQLDKIFMNGCEGHRVWDKYISPNGAVNDNAYFVIDLGMKVTLMGVTLKNLQNFHYHDRCLKYN